MEGHMWKNVGRFESIWFETWTW